MKNPLSKKKRLVIILLLTVLTMQGTALLLFRGVDNITHKDLYEYGLQFNTAWANPYWSNSHIFSISLIIATILIATKIALTLHLPKNNNELQTSVEYVIPFLVISLNLLSIFTFNSLTQIIQLDLINYGLQLSFEWVTPLLTYSTLLTSLIGAATAITTATPFLSYFSQRQKTLKETSETTRVTKITPSKSPLKITSFTLITAGTTVLLTSIFSNSPIFAFIGLGLTFWGILFIYIRTEEYTKKTLAAAVANPPNATLTQMIQELGFKGKPIYLPPKYFTNPETQKVFIPAQEDTLPTPEQIQKQESHVFTTNPRGMLMTPLGTELTKIFEETLSTDLTRINLQYLQEKLPKILIEELEIAQDFEMETENNRIHVQIGYTPTSGLNNRLEIDEQDQNPLLASPLTSAIAIALAKATGNSVTVEKQQTNLINKTITIEYRLKTEEEQDQT